MKNILNKHIIVFSIVVLLWFLRMTLPGVIYIFIPAFTIYSIIFFIQFHKAYLYKNLVIEFIKTYNPLFILGIFYILGVFITGKFLDRNVKDLFELFVALLILFYYFILIHQSKESDTLHEIFRSITKFIGISSIIVAIIGLTKFGLQIIEIPIPIETPIGTSINSDKNFFALYSFLGVISIIPFLTKKQNVGIRVLLQLGITTLLANILFSYSYRGILILFLLFIGLILVNTISFFKTKQLIINHIRNNTFVMLLTLVLLGVAFSQFSDNKLKLQVYKHVEVFQDNHVELTYNAFHFNKWSYAIEYYQNQTVIEKIFGNGFNYLEDFGQEFNGNKELIDYPHNPILSALLYSGFVGAIFAILFLIISVYYGILYFKKYPLFSLMLFTSLLFVFFSGNSLFSVPIFLFLFSLSFMIRHQEITDLKIEANLAKPGSKLLKELFDYVVSTIFFIVLFPILLFVSLLVFIIMGWPFIYSQTRIGQNGKPFRLHKFRTMTIVESDTTVAASETTRISKLGVILRKTKIDELPELINIIRGDMSFVGPRPDVPGYADKLKGDDRVILNLKPGITGVASLKYINEEDILSKQSNPEEYNDEVIWPDKVKVNKLYYENWSFFTDIKVLVYTLLRKRFDY